MQSLSESPRDRRLLPQLNVQGQQISLAVDFLDASSRFLNGEPVRARFYYLGEEGYVFSRASAQEVPLIQEAPGRYVCQYRAPKKGLYIVRVAGSGPREVAAMGVVVSLLSEDTTLACDQAELSRWAAAAGGEVTGAADRWAAAPMGVASTCDVGKWAMIFAAIVFCLDVILRRWPAVASLLARRQNA